MNRENVLFLVIGLLIGSFVASHFAVHMNRNLAAPAGAESAAGLPANHPAVGDGDETDRQQLLATAEQVGGEARKAPDNFDAQVRAAEAYFRAGSYEDSIDFMTRANKLRPDDYQTVFNLGQVYSAAKRFEDAERWFTAALDKRPEDCEARSELAYTFYMRKPGQPDKAIAELRRCLQTDPNNAHSLYNLAVMLMETKKYDESEATLARLEQADPTYQQLPLLREELRKARAGTQTKSPTD